MRPRSIVLLLLLALALRLGAGPHPCHAMAVSSSSTTAHAACHESPRPKAPSPGSDDCCKGDHALCEQACQKAARLQVSLVLPDSQTFQELTWSLEDRSMPPVVFPIDHIPLA
ncbi:MAG TPA: hypothetical protein VGH73_01160 [Thermoanaerobaculia bacterium]|jgi:hypothetical protein